MDKKLIFSLFRAPGDVVVFSNVYRDFKLAYPEIEIDALTPYPEITYLNKNLTRLPKKEHIPLINFTDIDFSFYRSGNFHYSYALIDWLKENTEYTEIKQTSNIPEIHLADWEKDREYILSKYDLDGDFWLINAGIKVDMPLKSWVLPYWNDLLYWLKENNIQVVQVGSNRDIHPEFKYCKSLVGRTENLRDYLALCYHARGGICGVTAHMHVMAAFGKPCIVLAGGRENPAWEAYPFHTFLHSVGKLDCCKSNGCWLRQRNECLDMVDIEFNGNLFKYPRCMRSITPEIVLKHVLDYEGR